MSGIVAILNLDGRPVDRSLLNRVTAFLSFRGPHIQQIWMNSGVGLGHALLSTTDGARHEHQPVSLDGRVWITADVRLDDRDGLIGRLESKGWRAVDHPTDAALLLGAYEVWGDGCLEQVIGDFAFVLWDGRTRRLLCGRDHFGIKQLYYAHLANTLVVSNTLDCIRLHPTVSTRLNESAVADFLLFEYNREPTTTTFADIQRLPPAHGLVCDDGRLRRWRYWTLPIKAPVRYRAAADYVDRFTELLGDAVNDRLPASPGAVLMSGGVDSTTVAALAARPCSSGHPSVELRAHTVVYDSLFPDDERHYSGVAADALGIPIQYLVADGYALYDRWNEAAMRTPEPLHHPLLAKDRDLFRQVSARSTVALTGQGADPAFLYSVAYGVGLLKRGRLLHFLAQLSRAIVFGRSVPAMGLRTTVKRWLGRLPEPARYPNWLNPSFATNLELPGRWSEFNKAAPASRHPTRPDAYDCLTDGSMTPVLEYHDASVTRVGVEMRHPFFDLRLLDFLLTIPPLPWCVDKTLVRMAMEPFLPERIRRRPKTPLRGDPVFESLRRHGKRWLEEDRLGPEVSPYVDAAAHTLDDVDDPDAVLVQLRPYSLSHWLKNHTRSPERETTDEVGRRSVQEVLSHPGPRGVWDGPGDNEQLRGRGQARRQHRASEHE